MNKMSVIHANDGHFIIVKFNATVQADQKACNDCFSCQGTTQK